MKMVFETKSSIDEQISSLSASDTQKLTQFVTLLPLLDEEEKAIVSANLSEFTMLENAGEMYAFIALKKRAQFENKQGGAEQSGGAGANGAASGSARRRSAVVERAI